MREYKFSAILLCSTVLSAFVLVNSASATTVSTALVDAIKAINSGSSTTVTTQLEANSTPEVIVDPDTTGSFSPQSYLPVTKQINWTVDGTNSQSQGKQVLGSIAMVPSNATSVGGKLTVKKIGAFVSDELQSYLEAYQEDPTIAKLKNVLGEVSDSNNLHGYLTNIVPYLRGNGSNGLNGVTTSIVPAILGIDVDLDVSDTVIAGSVTGSEALLAGDNGAGISARKTITGDGAPEVSLTNNILLKNSTYGNGAAVNLDNANFSIANNYFVENSALTSAALGSVNGHGGAVDLTGSGSLTGNIFYKNTANELGGGLFIHKGSEVESARNIFLENRAINQAGGAILNVGTLESNNDLFVDNTANGTGGAIANVLIRYQLDQGEVVDAPGTLHIQNAGFQGNTSTAGAGGAVGNEGHATISNSHFEGNTANNGGAILNASATYQSNGASQQTSGTLVLNGTSFDGNEAQYDGGAIYNLNGTVTVSNAGFTNNVSVDGGGGAIYNGGTLNIGSSVSFSGNTANKDGGAAIFNEGVVNIVGANDMIDLDYPPYTNNTTPTTGRRLFGNNQDVVNGYVSSAGESIHGTINIQDSQLQLHNSDDLSKGVINVRGNKLGTVNVEDSRVDIGKSTLYANEVNIKEGSEILTHIDARTNDEFGKISANTINVADNDTDLTIIVKSGEHMNEGESKTFQILDAGTNGSGVSGDFATITENKMYTITKEGDGAYTLSRNKESGGYEGTVCPNGGCIHNAWVEEGKMEGHSKAEQIQDLLNEKAQTIGCDSKEYQDALAGIAPDVSPLIQAHSTEITRRLAGIISKQLYSSMERTGYIHRGKRFYKFPQRQSRLWVQGLYGQSEFTGDKGFDVDTEGLAVGFDAHISPNSKLGIAYSYTMADGTAVQRDTEVSSHSLMVYGGYNPNRFYTNWLALYTRSSYEENKKVFNQRIKADYDVDVFGAQIMLGNKMGPFVIGNWASGVLSPEVGLRYTYIKQHGYTDQAGQKVDAADGQILTGILGAQYTIGYVLSPGVSWYPELRAALTYDFIEPDMENAVTLVNGSKYQVVSENLDKFGIEIGARIGLDINRKTEIAVEYEGLFKGDYTNHTGIASLKYKF